MVYININLNICCMISYNLEKRLQQYEILWKWAVLFNSIDKKGLIEENLRTILESWRSTQEAEGVALEMR